MVRPSILSILLASVCALGSGAVGVNGAELRGAAASLVQGQPARAIVEDLDGTGYFVLYGDGSVVGYAGANPAYEHPAIWGWDIARDLVVSPTGGGYYILDGFGGTHNVGNVPTISDAVYFGWDIARALEFTGPSAGYTLDGWGALHPFGGAPSVNFTYWPGWDIARDVDAGTNGALYVLDGFGGVHQIGGNSHVYYTEFEYVDPPQPHYEPSFKGLPYWNADVARRLEITADGEGVYVLDKYGEIHHAGSANWLVNRSEAFNFLGNVDDGSIQEAMSAADLLLRADGNRLYRLTRDGTTTVGQVDHSVTKVSAVLDFEWFPLGTMEYLSSTDQGNWDVWRNESGVDQYLVGITKRLNNNGHKEGFGSDQVVYLYDETEVDPTQIWVSELGITGLCDPENWANCERALDQGTWNTYTNTLILPYSPLVLAQGGTVTINHTGAEYFLQPPDVRYTTPIRIKPFEKIVSHQIIYGEELTECDPDCAPAADFTMSVELYFANTPPPNPGRIMSSPVYDQLIDFDLPRLDLFNDASVVGAWDPRVNNTSNTWRVHGYDRYLSISEGLSGEACLYVTSGGQWQVKHCTSFQRGSQQKLWRPDTMVVLPTPVDVPPGEGIVVHYRFDKVPTQIYNPTGWDADGGASMHIEEIPGSGS